MSGLADQPSHSDATFEALVPELRERILRHGAHLFAQELGAFGTDVPDAVRICAGVLVRLLVSRDGAPQLAPATAQFAGQLEVELEWISGHHASHLQQPEAFAEKLRPILLELS